MSDAGSPLRVDYENPPVTEVVCGILFKPVESLLAPHFGLLWQSFKSDYPGCQEVAPLAPVVEHFDESPSIGLQFGDKPPLPRIWFVHTNETRIIQVQRDRFLHNWRKVRPEDDYPRYPEVFRMFRERLSQFELFLKEEELGKIEPLQYELTYVNRILKGYGWTTLGDMGKALRDLAWQSAGERFLPIPEAVLWRTTFLLPDRLGRLRVTARDALRREDGHPLIQLELTARGMGRDASTDAMIDWFELAHKWIVRGFADLTGEEIQKSVWRRKT